MRSHNQWWIWMMVMVVSVGAARSASGFSVILQDKGIVVAAGSAGEFDLPFPTFRKGDQTLEPLSKEISKDGHSATLQYAGNGKIALRLSDNGDIAFDVTSPSANTNTDAVRMQMLIPDSFIGGGKWACGGAQLSDLPKALGKSPFLYQGNAQRFTILSRTGKGMTIELPEGTYQQFQDNRAWDWGVFAWFGDIPAKAGTHTQFAVKVTAAGGSAKPAIVADRFGQSVSADYPWKIKDENGLKATVTDEKAYYAGLHAPDRDPYGGLVGSGKQYKLQATGFFHLGVADGKQVMVTPAGNIFFQLGICTMNSQSTMTKFKGREDIYAWLPDPKGPYASAYNLPEQFSFYRANWIRKYGGPFDGERWSGQIVERLKAWGFNSAGDFSDRTDTQQKMGFPYVLGLPIDSWDLDGFMLADLGNEIFDPFAPNLDKKLDDLFAKNVAPHANDPLLIGYFLANEQPFQDIPKTIPRLKGNIAAKQHLVALLRKKYPTIAAFNKAWSVDAASFDALGDMSLPVQTEAAEADMRDYNEQFLDAYYGIISRTFHKYDSHHLLLGSRWQPRTANSSILCQVAGRYMDVISVNYYTYGVEKSFLDKIHQESGGKPLLLSEWGFGTPETGLAGGVRNVSNQIERGLAYRNYVETAASLGYVVGMEWFQYTDEPLTGRWIGGYHGENMNTGLVDVTDQPYKAFLAECMKTNDGIYKVLLGQSKPYHYDNPRFTVAATKTRKTALIPRASAPIKVDGSSADWSQSRPPYRISGQDMVFGENDGGVSADFQLAWDDTNLYVLVQLHDPTPLQNLQTGDAIWNADAVELFFGPDKLDTAGSLRFNDRQLVIRGSVAKSPDDAYHWYNTTTPTACRTAVMRNADGSGYTVEAEIPFASIGITPREGGTFLFDLGIDDSTNGIKRQRQFMWNGIARNASDRGAWGLAKLVQ